MFEFDTVLKNNTLTLSRDISFDDNTEVHITISAIPETKGKPNFAALDEIFGGLSHDEAEKIRTNRMNLRSSK